MRLCALRLAAFGPFADAALDFGEGRGLHIVYGHNEAGKSSALRAITALFYGIPPRTLDAHRHDMPRLRIGGVLAGADGERVELWRRKGQKRTLLDAAGAAVDEAVLERLLGGVSEKVFLTMFGLDHVTLREGAQAILAGQGDVGESLFDAGGARGVGGVLEGLRREADELYRPKAEKPRLNMALRSYRELKERLALKEMQPGAYLAQKQALADAQAEHGALATQRAELAAEEGRLARALRVAPQLAKRRDLLARRAELGAVPELEPDAKARRLAAYTERETSTRRIAELEAEVAALATERAGLAIDEALTELPAELVRDIGDRLGNHRKAARDLPIRQKSLEERRLEAAGLLADLPFAVALDEVEGLRVDKAAQARIDALGHEHGRRVAELEAAEQARDEAQARLATHRRALAGLAGDEGAASLRRVVERALAEGDVEEELAGVERRAEALRARLQHELAAAGLAGRDAARLEVPARGAVAAIAREIDEERQRAAALAQRAVELAEREEHVRTELAELEELGAPSLPALERAQQARDAAWAPLGDALERGTRASPAAYLAAVTEVDRLYDQLWREADRVAKRARLRAEAAGLARQQADLGHRREEAARRTEELERRRAAPWQALGVAEPADAERWLARHEAIVALAAELEAATAERDRLGRAVAAQRAALAPDGADAPLAALLDRARARLDEAEEVARRRATLEAHVNELEAQIALHEGRCHERAAALASWREGWAAEMTAIRLAPGASVAEASVVIGTLRDVYAKLREARELEGRIAGMQRDARAFEGIVLPRAAAHAIAGEVDHAADTLLRLHAEALKARSRRDDIDQRRTKLEGEIAAARARLRGAEETLDELLRAARVETLEALEQVEERAVTLKNLDERLRETEDALFAEGAGIAELEALVEARDLDAARSRIAAIEEERARAGDRSEQLLMSIGRIEEGLKKNFEAHEGAHAVAADAQAALAAIRGLTRRYAGARLAAVILEQAIDRYRQEHQGPVLQRASALFQRLTAGSYQSLLVHYDEEDHPELGCSRADGSEVTVEGLSDGTRDQLYLALRLASLERFAERGDPLPFVVDDVLIHFDDSRARAALGVLAELSAVTEVLFFTHHARLVDIARDIGDGRIHFHTLP